MKYDLKGLPRSYKTTFMPKSFVSGPILIKICMNANIMKTKFFHECHFYIIEKFFIALRPLRPYYNLDVLTDNCIVSIFVCVS